MKSFFRLTFTFCAAAILFSACSKKNEEGKMIPKNAMFVAYLNTKSLKEKLTWNDIKQTSWYKQVYADTAAKDWMKKLLDNPENSGIDLDGGLILFAVKNIGTDGEMMLEGRVKSKKDFEQFNKNLDATATTRTDGDLSMLTLKDKSVVAWNDKNFVYAVNKSSFGQKYSFPGDTLNNSNAMAPAADQSMALSAVCKNLFSLKSDSSLEKNEKFSDLLKENGDIHGWVNTEEIMKSSPSLGMVGMLKLDVFLKDNISTYTVNFDNGKINIKQKGYAGKEFTDFLKKYSGGNINTDMIKTIPSTNVFGVLAMNFKPEGIKELIKLTGMDGFLNMYTGQMGFNLDDFVKANKGDIAVAVTDFKMKTDSFNYKDEQGNTTNSNVFTKPDLNYLFSVGIGDKASFQKLIDAGKKLTSQMGRNDTTISYGQNDKLFAVSNQQHFLNDYLAGNSKNKYDFIDKLSGHPISIFVDIHKILSVLSVEKKGNADDELIMNESLKLWNNIYVTAGEMDKDAITGKTEINFVDQNTNSLKQLNHYFDEIAKVEMAKKERQKSEMKIDSLMIPPPMDTVGHK
ncbi:MAG: DUF4836 family protein [Ginsengibacter sp.]